jgi:hypothetical protein
MGRRSDFVEERMRICVHCAWEVGRKGCKCGGKTWATNVANHQDEYVRCNFGPVQSMSLYKTTGREKLPRWNDLLTLVGESSIVSAPGSNGNDRGKVYRFRTEQLRIVGWQLGTILRGTDGHSRCGM